MLEERKDGLYDVNEVGVESILEDYEDGYYHVFQDVYKYPESNVLVAYSRRGPGKTTGALLGCMYRGLKLMYIKRTIADVKMITKGGAVDLSPWATVNRLCSTNYKAVPVKGVDGFAEVIPHDSEGVPIEDAEPIGYICALSAAGKIKGFDLSDKVDVMLVDEFVPNKGVIARQSEGDQTLDILATLMRDRHKRGLPDIKLWLFSNCDYLACPISRTLGLLDDIYELSASEDSYYYNPDRRMLIHHITSDEFSTATNDTVFSFMKGTDWYKRNVIGLFDIDTTNIYRAQSLKNYKAIATINYNNKKAYILYRESDSSYFITYDYKGRLGNDVMKFDFSYENDVRLWYATPLYYNILQAMMLGKVKYDTYSLYDLFKNFYSIFGESLY